MLNTHLKIQPKYLGFKSTVCSAWDKGYRYGFNTQEKDDEIAGVGNIYTAEYWEYDSRLGRRWNLDPMHHEWETPYSVYFNQPIFFVDYKGNIPIPPCVYKGAIVGGVSEFAFQIFDLMLLEGLDFTSAIVNVDISDIMVEIGKGGAMDCWSKYSVERLNKMLTGKYRQFTFYAIQQGVDIIEGTVNSVIKDNLNGESIDLKSKLKSVVEGQIYNEIFSAKPLVDNFLKRKSSAIRKNVAKSKNAFEKANQYGEKAKDLNYSDKKRKTFLKQEKKYIEKGNKFHDKAKGILAKEYSKLAGSEVTVELLKRADKKVSEYTGKKINDANIKSGSVEYENIED